MLNLGHILALGRIAVLALAVAGLGGPAAAGKGCVSLDKRVGGEALVNRCASCRIVNLTRSRPGGLAPTSRTYRVPGEARIDLAFKGPGNTRILSDVDCQGGAAQELENRKCVRFHRFADGSPALFNECPACRAVVVEREDDEGDRTRSTYTLNNRAYLPLRSLGAKVARIVSDKACR